MFPSRNKYSSTRINYDGYSFASKLEAALYQQLKLEVKAGIWKSISCQTRVKLTDAEIVYIPDFRVTDPQGMDTYVEAKGFETPEWRIKRRLWEHYGPGPLLIYKGSHTRLRLAETILPVKRNHPCTCAQS